jgi:hypothetical protein
MIPRFNRAVLNVAHASISRRRRSIRSVRLYSPEHRLHSARDIRLAASGDVAARRKLGRYLAQRHALIVTPSATASRREPERAVDDIADLRSAPLTAACGLDAASRQRSGNATERLHATCPDLLDNGPHIGSERVGRRRRAGYRDFNADVGRTTEVEIADCPSVPSCRAPFSWPSMVPMPERQPSFFPQFILPCETLHFLACMAPGGERRREGRTRDLRDGRDRGHPSQNNASLSRVNPARSRS